jgi:hypothetical protein
MRPRFETSRSAGKKRLAESRSAKLKPLDASGTWNGCDRASAAEALLPVE